MGKFIFITAKECPLIALQEFDDRYSINWELQSSRRLNDVQYSCSIYMYWEIDVEFISGWYYTPGEAIIDALEQAKKEYDYWQSGDIDD